MNKMNFIENIRYKLQPRSNVTLSRDEIANLELGIRDILVPITPRQEFVERLNRQLMSSAPLTWKRIQPNKRQQKTRDNLMIGIATVLGIAVIFTMGIRVAVTLLGGLGLIAQFISKKETHKRVPLRNI
jgi:hypothetical protein